MSGQTFDVYRLETFEGQGNSHGIGTRNENWTVGKNEIFYTSVKMCCVCDQDYSDTRRSFSSENRQRFLFDRLKFFT
jgi:hypothetical protein